MLFVIIFSPQDFLLAVPESVFGKQPNCVKLHILVKGHFTVIEPSKFQNKTMKSSNINALFCHTNTKMSENYNFGTLLSYHKLSYISRDTGITVTEGKIKNSCCLENEKEIWRHKVLYILIQMDKSFVTLVLIVRAYGLSKS